MVRYNLSPRAVGLTVALALPALVIAGCASDAPRPDNQLDTAQSAITQAQSSGARDAAPKLLKEANDKLDNARKQIDKEQYKQARRLLEKATADARLANARADTAESNKAVEQLNQTIQMLRDQMKENQS